MKRNSKKRQSVLECMKNTDCHPSAEWVYQSLKPIYPDISFGTVYRNLKELKSEGKICSVAVVSGKERFDARTEPHVHLICEKCGKIMDADAITLPPELIENARQSTGFSVSYAKLQFVGVCPDCLKQDG